MKIYCTTIPLITWWRKLIKVQLKLNPDDDDDDDDKSIEMKLILKYCNGSKSILEDENEEKWSALLKNSEILNWKN